MREDDGEIRYYVPVVRRLVVLAAVISFSIGPEGGPQPKLPIVVAAAQDKEVSATSRTKN